MCPLLLLMFVTESRVHMEKLNKQTNSDRLLYPLYIYKLSMSIFTGCTMKTEYRLKSLATLCKIGSMSLVTFVNYFRLM